MEKEDRDRIGYDTLYRSKHGDMAAMGVICEAYGKRIEAELLRIYPSMNEYDLQDCKQEVFCRMIRLISKRYKLR